MKKGKFLHYYNVGNALTQLMFHAMNKRQMLLC